MRWSSTSETLPPQSGKDELLLRMLEKRGFAAGTAQESFLHPRLSDLGNPEGIPGMPDAVELLAVEALAEAGAFAAVVPVAAAADAGGAAGAKAAQPETPP